MKDIEVAAAIIQKEDKIFVTRKGYGEFKGMWEFPGGKIEMGETPEEALVREIREELDSEVLVGQCFAEVDYDYPEFHLHMKCYLCRIKSGDLKLLEHSEAKWLTREELDSVEWLPADVGVIERLKDGCCGGTGIYVNNGIISKSIEMYSENKSIRYDEFDKRR